MELTDILMLWDRFDRSDASEMEVDYHGVRFALKKAQAGVPAAVQAVTADAFSGKTDGPEETVPEKHGGKTGKETKALIKAPLVGTFYAAPSPEDKPFVEIGKSVKKGDVVCIIEAMKLMNEVTAKEDGIVEEILVKDGELVSFDQPLMILKQE